MYLNRDVQCKYVFTTAVYQRGCGGREGGNGAIYVCNLNTFLSVLVKHCAGGNVFVHMHVSYTQMYMYRHMFTL